MKRIRVRYRFWIGVGIVFTLGLVLLAKHEFTGWTQPANFGCLEDNCEIKEVLVDGRRAKRSFLFRRQFDVLPGMRDIEVRTSIGVVRGKVEIEDREIYCYVQVAGKEIECGT